MMIREVAAKRASKIVMDTEDEYDPNKKWEINPTVGGVIKASMYNLGNNSESEEIGAYASPNRKSLTQKRSSFVNSYLRSNTHEERMSISSPLKRPSTVNRQSLGN